MDGNSLIDLGWHSIHAGDYTSAQNHFHLATVADVGLARAHMSLREALLATGSFQRAWQEYCWRSYLRCGPSGASKP